MKAFTTTALLVGVLLSGVATAQEETSEFGEPLVVNGVRIPDLEIKRFLIYGPGRNALEARKLEILMSQELELRVYTMREDMAGEQHGSGYDDLTDDQKAGIDTVVTESMARYDVDRDEAKAKIAEQVTDFQQRYPTLDPSTETRRAYRTVEWYEDQVYQTMRFDRMFFPGHTDNWPPLTVEAIHAGSPNYDLVKDYQEHWDYRKAESEETGEPMKEEQDMMMTLLRDYVIAALNSLVDTRVAVDGLDQEVVMTIEGLGLFDEVLTNDVYEEFKHGFTWRDIVEAKRFLALQSAAQQKLESLGALQDRDEYLDQIRETREALAANMFNWQFIALMGHQFPSEEAYTEHVYLLDSFRKTIEEDLILGEGNKLSPALAANMDYANVVMGLGRCLTEVCFVSAFDFPKNEWRAGGFAEAERRAIALRGEVDAYIDRLNTADDEKMKAVAEGKNYEWPEDLISFDQYWSNFLDLNSEFWDPPLPMTGKAPPDMGRKNKGRFQSEAMTRNDYKRSIGESSYYWYLWDTNTTDTVFMEQEETTVGGPYVGAWGYYIIYLRKRQAPTNPLNLSSERHVELMIDDYIRNQFTKFAHQALGEYEVKGLPEFDGSYR